MISKPRAPASAALADAGSTTVTAIGGCGFWKGRTIEPWPPEYEAAFEEVVEHRDLRGDRGGVAVREVDSACAERDPRR